MKKTILSVFVFLVLLTQAQQKKTLYIADHKVSCSGLASRECYLVKENKKSDWRNFYQFIEGFDFTEGYEYKIKVKVTKYEHVAADASRLTYQMLKLISKKKTGYKPSDKLNGSWTLEYIHQDTTYIKLIDTTSAFMEMNTATAKVNGKNICNTFFAAIKTDGNKIEFGELGSTRMMCEGMVLENLIFKMLREMTTFTVVANRLTLFSEDKLNRLEFVKR